MELTSCQKSIWLTQNLFLKSPLYNVGGYALLDGQVDLSALVEVISLVLNRCDSVKLGLKAFTEKPIQGSKGYKINILDYSSESDQDNRCLDWMYSDIKKSFNLHEELFQTTILVSNYNKVYWYIKVHHIVLDGYSMALLFNQVCYLYRQRVKGMDILDPPLNLYSDFIKDAIEYEKSSRFVLDREFWYFRLKNLKKTAAFGSLRKIISAESLTSKRKRLKISRTTYNRINDFCKVSSCSQFHYLLSTVLVLNRLYNNEDSLFGIPVNNRTNGKYKSSLGTFVNVLPFSVSIDIEESFSTILCRVRDEFKRCLKHRRLGLFNILSELDEAGNIYNATFSYQNVKYKGFADEIIAGIEFLSNGEQQEDLIFHLLNFSEEGDLELTIDYKVSVFSDESIEKLLVHFRNLLDHFYERPNSPVCDANLIEKAEIITLLTHFSGPRLALQEDRTIVDLFEEQVYKTPDLLALDAGETKLTYQELNNWSNRLGSYLRECYNVGPNELIGVKLERNEWVVIAILAILKSGAAYVPIDVTYPEDRINYIVRDSQCKIVLDHQKILEFKTTYLQYSATNLVKIHSSQDLAYVIYTSGSTGGPKGVMIEHKNVYSFIEWSLIEFSEANFDSVLGVTSISFDLSIFEIFHPLARGKNLIFLEDPFSIPDHLNVASRILLNTVPSVVGFLIDRKIDWSAVTVLNMAGEQIPQHFIEDLDCTKIEVRNLYGPTEDTTYSTCYRVQKGKSILIGAPISNTQIYILSSHLQLLPIGIIGDIYIGGAGLARGYLNNDDLTNIKFLDNPFFPGCKVYRSGDLGRWLPDGTIEFVGRSDDQVKIRGYRVELSEVERVFLKHPMVHSAIVVGRTDLGLSSELVAYFVAEDILSNSDLRSYLNKYLPTYMVPSYFIQLQSIPLMPNGKVNKLKLPSPTYESSSKILVEPRNEIEKKLVMIWRNILGIDRIGIEDNFFELGGHSLKATRLFFTILKEFNVNLKPALFFNNPTIAFISHEICAVLMVNRENIRDLPTDVEKVLL